MGEFTVKLGAVIIVLAAVLEGYCSAQAPGDEDNRCLSSPYVHTYEDDVKILMDSYNYLQLLPGNGTGNPPIASAFWNDRSFDGNDIVSTTAATYWQQSAGTCQFQIKVCGFRQPGATQDNWLFTQHISKSFDANTNNYDVEILVDITYALQSCRSNRNPPCNTRFKLYRYITNETQLPSTNGSGFMNKDNYVSFGTATPAATGARYTETHRFILQPQQTRFYIAIEDTGTCVIISRLLVYRHNCKSMQTGLVLYPETAAPVSDSSNIDITCVPNADDCGSPPIPCGSDGMWWPVNPTCGCRAGYEDVGTACNPCQSSYYSPCNGCHACVDNGCADGSCCPCPENTKTDQAAAAQCECLDGYFRNTESRESTDRAQAFVSVADEQPSTACTQPPSAPIGLTVAAVSSRSVFVQWSTPAQTGGRPDLYYQFEHSDPDNLGAFINTEYDDSTSHTFNNLRPATQYCVRVSAHNGVSDQDPDGAQLRTAEECTTTPEDIPGRVAGVQGHCSVVVWEEPTEPNGKILGYELDFFTFNDSTTVITENIQTFFVIENEYDLPYGKVIFVNISAINSVGKGRDSYPAYIGCEDPPCCNRCDDPPCCNITTPIPPIPRPMPECVQSVFLDGHLLYWERPPRRISSYVVNVSSDREQFEQTTTETYYLLPDDLEGGYSIQVFSVLDAFRDNCNTSIDVQFAVPQVTPECVQSVFLVGPLLYWERPPRKISFYVVNVSSSEEQFEWNTTATNYLLPENLEGEYSIQVYSVLDGVRDQCNTSIDVQLTVPQVTPECVQSVFLDGHLLYWERPPRRISFYVVNVSSDREQFEWNTTDTYYLLPDDLEGGYSIQVYSVLDGVRDNCNTSIDVQFNVPQRTPEPVLSVKQVGDLLYWETPPGRISFYVVKFYDGKEEFEQNTTEPYYLLERKGEYSIQVCPVLDGVRGDCSTAIDIKSLSEECDSTNNEDDGISLNLIVTAAAGCGGTALVVGTLVICIAAIHHCRYKKKHTLGKPAPTWEDYKLKTWTTD